MDTTEIRIVNRQKGTWRWQDAYGVVRYATRRTKDGRLVWTSELVLVRKASLPQLIRQGWTDVEVGSLHNQPAWTDDPYTNLQLVP